MTLFSNTASPVSRRTPRLQFGRRGGISESVAIQVQYWRVMKSDTKAYFSRREELVRRRGAALITPTDMGAKASTAIAAAMNGILEDVFALYLKTKHFHWHMSGAHFRDYHLLLDEQADQLYAMTDLERRMWFLFKSSRNVDWHGQRR